MTETVTPLAAEPIKSRKTWLWWLLFLGLAGGAAYWHFNGKYEAYLARLERAKQTTTTGSPDMPSSAKPAARSKGVPAAPAMPANLRPAPLPSSTPAPASAAEPAPTLSVAPAPEAVSPQLSPRELAYEQRLLKFEHRSETRGLKP